MLRLLVGIILIIVSIPTSFSLNHALDIESALNYLKNGDSDTAFTVLNRCASTNNIYAQFFIAQCYEFGIGVNKNLRQAFLMYRKCAERGLPQAMSELSRCYLNGIGVSKDLSKANSWSERYNSKGVIKQLPDLLALYHYDETNKKETPEKAFIEHNNTITENQTIPKELNSTIIAYPRDLSFRNSLPDVDIDIPKNNMVNANIFALIIANEEYQEVIHVDHALNDGEIFSLYCNSLLGIPRSNIHFVKNATLNNIKRELNLFSQISRAYNGEISFIIYYAGHGIPDEKTHKSFLMPIDSFPTDLSTCLSLEDLYQVFGSMRAKKIVVFLDACFSGSTRDEGMLASARGIAIKSDPGTPTGNTIVFSSSQGDETSYQFKEKRHGLFTYFLLKGLKSNNGNIALGKLFNYISENVLKKSLIINGKSQTPTATSSTVATTKWESWTLLD